MKTDLEKKDHELEKLKLRTNRQAIADLKVELRKAYDVMVHLKSQLGRPHDEQYDNLITEIADELGEIRMEKAIATQAVTKIVKNQTKSGLKAMVMTLHHKQPHVFVPHKRNVHPAWSSILKYFSLEDIFKVQGISVEFWCIVNPSSDTCLLNLKEQFGLQTKRPAHCYGSLVFILQEDDRIRQRENFEMQIYLRNEREKKLVETYEQRV